MKLPKTLAILVIISAICFVFQNEVFGFIGTLTTIAAVIVAIIVLVKPARV